MHWLMNLGVWNILFMSLIQVFLRASGSRPPLVLLLFFIVFVASCVGQFYYLDKMAKQVNSAQPLTQVKSVTQSPLVSIQATMELHFITLSLIDNIDQPNLWHEFYRLANVVYEGNTDAQTSDNFSVEQIITMTKELTQQYKAYHQLKLNLTQFELAFAEISKEKSQRFDEFETEVSFDKLSANANSGRLFSAYNYLNAKQLFVDTRRQGEALLASYHILLQSQDLHKVKINYDQSLTLTKLYNDKINAFADTPTRKSLQNWYQSIDGSSPFIDDTKQVLIETDKLKTMLDQELADFSGQIEEKYLKQIIAAQHKVVKRELSLRQANNLPDFEKTLIILLLANVLIFFFAWLIINYYGYRSRYYRGLLAGLKEPNT